MSLHIKAVTKALSYPLYPPNSARRRFSANRHTFCGGHRCIRKLLNWNKPQRAARSLLGSSPRPSSLCSQSGIQNSDPGRQRGTKGNLFFLVSFYVAVHFSCATSTQHPHTHGQARTERETEPWRNGLCRTNNGLSAAAPGSTQSHGSACCGRCRRSRN